ACRAAGTPAWYGPAAPARRRPARSPARPRLGVRALGELFQARVCFSHNLQRRSGAGQLGFQALVPATDAFQLDLLGVRLRARPCPARPASAPASRARRHSTMWEAYRPSRRSNAPLSPGSVSRSSSARIASLYSGLNLRRRGRAGSWSAMSPSCDATTVLVMLTIDVLLSRPERDKGLRQVSHVRLTDRAGPAWLRVCRPPTRPGLGVDHP